MGLVWVRKNKRSWYVIHKCTGSVAGCSFSFKGVHWVHYMIRYQKKCRQKKPASRSALDKEAQFQLYHMEPRHFCASICLMMCRFVYQKSPWREDLHIPFSAVAKPCVQQFYFQPHQDITTWEMKAPRGRVYCNSECLQCWDRWTWQEMCLNFKFLDSWA